MTENGISTELISNIFECLWCKITTANSVFYFTTIYHPPEHTCMISLYDARVEKGCMGQKKIRNSVCKRPQLPEL